jgi:alkanesulfonate monooxygenase SsuD/methylene tetrahydromethanopterin reductase-like flavin-dependent oxidoreductase (luciferase family)
MWHPCRRVHKLARETVTLDLLSSGRLTLGVGLGSARNGELGPFGEVADPRERARLLDQGLADLTRYWAGEFQPVPVQQPRIGLPGPEALAELVDEIRESRPAADPFDVIVDLPPGEDPAGWARAGATWAVTDFGMQPSLDQVREVIDAGPVGR